MTPFERSRAELPKDIRKALEESNLPIEVATAIADVCEQRAEVGTPRVAHSKSEYKRLSAQGANVVPPSATDASQARDAAHLRTTLEYIARLPDSYPASAIVARAKNALKSAATDDTTRKP